MKTLKGQNFRVLTFPETTGAPKAKVFAKATNCVITLGTNTEDESTKDDVGLASRPGIMSKNFSVQVDTLNVSDITEMLAAIKAGTVFNLLWDKVSEVNNQAPVGDGTGYYGKAILTDLTYTFNDRENASCSAQFQGCGVISSSDEATLELITVDDNFTKGQKVRLFISDVATPATVVGAAKQLTLHVSAQTESTTTKDTDADWEDFDITAISYDISSTALVATNEAIKSSVGSASLQSMQEHFAESDLMYWQIANVSGPNNRTKGAVICSGRAYITQLQINAQNRQTADYNTSLTGYGELKIGA